MIEHVALVVLAAALVVTVVQMTRAAQAERRQAARERGLLIDQLLHATGNTWTPPPAEEPRPVAPPREPVPVRFTATPEQFPV